jgi:hypothetical protein
MIPNPATAAERFVLLKPPDDTVDYAGVEAAATKAAEPLGGATEFEIEPNDGNMVSFADGSVAVYTDRGWEVVAD